MNFMVRPSKSFLFDFLESKLKKFNQGIGLDVASGDLKNRRFFKTEKYFGLDIDLEALKSGIVKYNDNKTFGLYADLTRLEGLPRNSIDVLVSTNTLYSLAPEARIKAIEGLCRLVKPKGWFFCGLSLDNEFNQCLMLIKKNFKKVEIIYYKNIFSQTYEKIFEKNGYLGSHPIAGKKPFRLLSWLISRLEYLTGKFASLNEEVIIIAQEKINQNGENNFNLDNLPIINKRIYYLK